MKVTAKKLTGNLHVFDFDCKSTQEIEFFVSSDWHFDNPKCNRKLLFKHLDEAVKRGAYIIVTGDMLCLMQGKYDPRRDKGSIRPEHNNTNYLDLVINDTAEKLMPYAKNILFISKGNHETGVSNRMETSVLERLVERINTKAGTNIQLGAYAGFYTLNFNYRGTNKYPLNVGYHHGNWGGVITKGTLSVVRMASIMPDADVVFSGHTHDGWIMPHSRFRVNRQRGKVEVKKQWHIKTGTYKEEFEDGEGWATERIAMPKYLGGCWMKVKYNSNKGIETEFTLTS